MPGPSRTHFVDTWGVDKGRTEKLLWLGCGRERSATKKLVFLVSFHEGFDGFLAALGADLQVVAVVRERLLAPLASSDSRRFHLGDLFEQ